MSEFPDDWGNIAERPFTKTWQSMQNKANKNKSLLLYFLITKDLLLSVDEVNAMVEYVKAGNDLFISAIIWIANYWMTDCSVNRKGEIISEVNGKMQRHACKYVLWK